MTELSSWIPKPDSDIGKGTEDSPQWLPKPDGTPINDGQGDLFEALGLSHLPSEDDTPSELETIEAMGLAKVEATDILTKMFKNKGFK